ncbi:MAG: hypothetical protein CVU97_03490 [Firmicutes bacterium HGW-Firmicutes-21]|nr:MAG: hypothetical protein CVU97_03490 [Firmicutes bacterium HGW-Firmicutes-21]
MSAFSIFTNKRTKKKQASLPTVEEYYLRLARRTTLAKFICIMLTVGFALFAFSNFKDDLTTENFRYMLKFINLGADTMEEAASAVYFDSDATNKGEIIKGDLAVLNTNGLSVYDFKGSRLQKSDFKYANPKIVSNTKNIIAYDLGGYGLKIFSSYSAVYTQNFSYPIYGLSVSDNGGFVVVSSAKGYRSAFFVYDEYYRVIYNYYFGDKYIDCASISEDGKEVVTLLHYSKDGELITLLMKFSVSDEEAVFQTEFTDELPLKVSFMSDGSYTVLTSEALRFFSSDNRLTSEIFFKEKSILGYEFGKNYAIIAYNTVGLSSGTELDIYSKDGTLVAVRAFEGAVLDKKVSSDTLYVLSHGALTTIDLKGTNEDKTTETDSEFRQLILDGTSLILFSVNKAEYYRESGVQSDLSE